MSTTVPHESPSPHLIRVSDAARKLDVSERFLRNQVARGRLPAVRLGARVLRLSSETVERLSREGLAAFPMPAEPEPTP